MTLDGDGRMRLTERADAQLEAVSLLRPVWRNGEFLVRETFDVVRARARNFDPSRSGAG